jgi:hypothetical protein
MRQMLVFGPLDGPGEVVQIESLLRANDGTTVPYYLDFGILVFPSLLYMVFSGLRTLSPSPFSLGSSLRGPF